MLDMVRRGKADNVSRCVAQGVNVDYRDGDGNTALHIGAYEGQAQIIQMLVRAGANTNLKNSDGFTPMDVFMRTNAIARMLRGELNNNKISPASYSRLK